MTRKEDILNSAEALARRHGYDGFSYADIASDVGIRKASIHYHFASKADLGLALMQRYRGDFATNLAKTTDLLPRAANKLSAYLDIYKSALAGGEMVCLCVAFSAVRGSLSPEVLLELNGFHEDGLTWLEGVFAQARADGSIDGAEDPISEAVATLALVEGAHLMARAAVDVARFDAAISMLRSRLETV